jgi:hypothetical protein
MCDKKNIMWLVVVLLVIVIVVKMCDKNENYREEINLIQKQKMISPSAISQLKDNYTEEWKKINNTYNMDKLYELWCDKSTINSKEINCIGYYKFSGNYNGYWNANFLYDTESNKYKYILGSGTLASSHSNGLTQNQLKQLIQIY